MGMSGPQRVLLTNLSMGCRVTFRNGAYTVLDSHGNLVSRIWPATFYGFYDSGYVTSDENGDYKLSAEGWKLINGGNNGE